jgi:hypothetical protein
MIYLYFKLITMYALKEIERKYIQQGYEQKVFYW